MGEVWQEQSIKEGRSILTWHCLALPVLNVKFKVDRLLLFLKFTETHTLMLLSPGFSHPSCHCATITRIGQFKRWWAVSFTLSTMLYFLLRIFKSFNRDAYESYHIFSVNTRRYVFHSFSLWSWCLIYFSKIWLSKIKPKNIWRSKMKSGAISAIHIYIYSVPYLMLLD